MKKRKKMKRPWKHIKKNRTAGAVSMMNAVINQLTKNVLKIKKKRKIMMIRKKEVNTKEEVLLVYILIVVC